MRKPPKADSVIAMKMRQSLIANRSNLRHDWSEVFKKGISKALSKPIANFPKKPKVRKFGSLINTNVQKIHDLFASINGKLDQFEASDPQKNAGSTAPPLLETRVIENRKRKFSESEGVEDPPPLKKRHDEDIFYENFFDKENVTGGSHIDKSMPVLIAEDIDELKEATPVTNTYTNRNQTGSGLVPKKKRGRPPKPKLNLVDDQENGLAVKKKRGRPPKPKVNCVEHQGNGLAVKKKRGRPPKKQQEPGGTTKKSIHFSLPVEFVKPKFRIVPADRPYKYVKKNLKRKVSSTIHSSIDDSNIINFPNTKWSPSEALNSIVYTRVEPETLARPNENLESPDFNNNEVIDNFLKDLDVSSIRILEQVLEVYKQDFVQGENTIFWTGTLEDLIDFKFDIPPAKGNENCQDSVDSPIKFDLRKTIIDDYNSKLDEMQEALIAHSKNWGLSTLSLLKRIKERERQQEGRILVRNRTQKSNKRVQFCLK